MTHVPKRVRHSVPDYHPPFFLERAMGCGSIAPHPFPRDKTTGSREKEANLLL